MELGRIQIARRWLGAAVGLASAAYFVGEVWRRWPDIAALPWSASVVGALASAVLLQLSSALLDGWSWAWLLRAMHVDAGSREAIAIFGVAQFSKYLPGNVAQHVGRIEEARKRGWQTGRVVLSMLMENGFAVFAGALVAGAGVLMLPGRDDQTTRTAVAAVGLFAGSIVGGLVLQRLLARPPAFLRRWLATENAILFRASLLLAYLSVHLLSYVAIGGGLVLILHGLLGSWPPGLWRAPAAVAVSWLAGYLVPGAPAGLGVREATLTALLGPSLGVGVVVSAALLWRVAALATDVAMLGLGVALRRATAPVT